MRQLFNARCGILRALEPDRTMPDSAVSASAARETAAPFQRRLPIGAELIDSKTTHVRVWAPHASRVEVVTRHGEHAELEREEGGYFSGRIHASAGDRYGFRLDDDERVYPDPASRFQPEGPHGHSAIVDP